MRLPLRAPAAALALAAASRLASFASDGLEPASALCGPYYEELLAKGAVVRSSEGGKPALLPLDPAAAGLRSAIEAEKPGIMVESVFLLRRPAPTDASGAEEEAAAIHGILRSFTTLEGIQYYSVTHKKMRTLYLESYRIDGPESRRRLPDPGFPARGGIKGEETFFAFQRDTTFGANIYNYSYRALPRGVSLTMTNLTRMSYGPIPMVAPGALVTRLLVVSASDALVFYVESGTAPVALFKSRLEESFANRAAALFAWFKARLEARRGA